MKTVDATGTVVNGYTYHIYGKKTSSTGSQANEFDFAGQQTDATGLQYLRARYYDPATGTFLSRDPMAASPRWTEGHYSYARGNPVKGSDPTGLCSLQYCLGLPGISADGGSVPEFERSVEVFCGGICDAIGDGMGKVRDWGGAAAGAAWNAAAGVTGHVKDVVRSIANAELTTLVLASTSSFASCNIDSHLFFTCTGIAAVDSINVGGFTLGDVYLLGNEFNPDIKLQPVSLRHERRHAEQWAAAGLSTPMNPLLGQSAMFGAYMANYVITGGNACNNLFEVLAGLGDGGYLGC